MILEEIRAIVLIQIFGILALIWLFVTLASLLIKPRGPKEIWTNGWMKKVNGWVKWNKGKSKQKSKKNN